MLIFIIIFIIVNYKCNEGFSVGILNYNDACEKDSTCNVEGQCRENPCECVMDDVEDELGKCIPIDPERAYLFLLDSNETPYIAKTFYDRSSAMAYVDGLKEPVNIIIAESEEKAQIEIDSQINLQYCKFMKQTIDDNVRDTSFDNRKISRITKRISKYLEKVGDPNIVVITVDGELYAQDHGDNLVPGNVIIHEIYGEIIIPETDIDGRRITVDNSTIEIRFEHLT